ncbi:MAG: TRAP transporter substrate-binding protein [Halieaceae bacterium]|jgi:tripartite ATP-independent transporter DctP family solute receptor|nr:TRAP transporter substrate-binding protein [Halieaceae bacterium]MDA8883724.1 TRAP transporter substrate-binding protein [Planktomarina temperata]MDA9261332.1 TRAP transporter substrate-binding protein [Planktomarina temperata]MDB4218322.1 TRAP transporter substrate-binding protein [Planktomarina temperata]MDC0496193.1 TRAP transporter substrate-binding protein [Planktomarina temperata]
MKLLTTLTLGASLLIGTTAMAQDHIMRLSHGENDNNPTHVMAVKFEELVEKYTDGRIDVQIFGSNQLGSEQEVAQSVRTGSIEAEILYTGNLVPLAPSIGVMMLPYAFTSTQEAHAAMDALQDPLNERLPGEAGVRVLGYLEKGFRVLTNSEREVRNLDDLQGLKIRVSKNNIAIETFRSWGLDPIPMAWAEVFPALQQGVIDGQENPYTTAVSMKFNEVQSYISEIHYLIWSGPLIVSERWYQGLDADLQEALNKAGREAATFGRANSASETKVAMKVLVEMGMTLSGAPEDEAKWQEAARALWPSFAEEIGGEEWVTKAGSIIAEATANLSN